MAQHLITWLFGIAATLTISTAASAGQGSAAIDTIVNDCAFNAGVSGSYYITPVKYGNTSAYTVPPGADVSAAQSKKINSCIAQAVQGPKSPKPPQQRARAKAPINTAACLQDYKHKLRTTDNGRTYRGNNRGTRLFSGLLGRGIGRKLIENEYDRCLNHVAYAEDRCPNGVFSNGAGYCVRRPYR